MYDIITFGSAVVDVFINTGLAEKKGFIAYPVGSKILIKDLKFDIGGGGTNTAVAFSRFGLKTGSICKIGDDENGKKIIDLFKNEKIDFLGKIQKNSKSGYSVILDSKEHDRTILTYKGINNNIGFGEIPLNKIKTKWIYFSSLLEKSFETQKKLAKILVKKGVKIAFNPSSYLLEKKPIPKTLIELLKLSEVLILNKEEAELLCKNKDKKKMLIEIHKLGPRIVVITDADKLVCCYDSYANGKYFLKPKKFKIVEKTGAGDAFASGFVAGLIVGKNIKQSMELGQKEAESVIKHYGAKNNLMKVKLR